MMPMLKHRAPELEAKIRRHQRLYDLGTPEITDAEFDALVVELRSVSPDSVVLSELGSAVTKRTVSHRVAMLSLDKVYEQDDLLAWAQRVRPLEVIAQPKYDGLAVSLVYQSGKLVSASTRGDGTAGDEITQAIRFAASKPHGLNIPLVLKDDLGGVDEQPVLVRGELLMPIETFKARYADEYANPRNLIAGLAQRDSDHGPLYDARFVAYDYYLEGYEDEDTLSMKLSSLAYAGFDTGEHEEIDAHEDLVHHAKRKWVTPFEIDGVVFKANSAKDRRALGATAHHPRWAVAWKYQGQTGATTLLNIEWEVSRTGAITPIAVMSPIELSGVTVTRATLHNINRFRTFMPCENATLIVTRRGGVIPHVESVTSDYQKQRKFDQPQVCPSCQGYVNDDLTTLYCRNTRTCPAVQRERIRYWCSTTGMLGIGPEFVDRMVNSGQVNTMVDLYRLDAMKLSLAGFGPGQAANVLSEIDKTRTLTPEVFLASLGIEHLGLTTAKKILPLMNWETMSLREMKGMKMRTIQSGLSTREDLIDTLLIYIRLEHEKPAALIAQVGGPFAGKKVVFTGALTDMDRSVAQDLVRQYGGETPTSLTRETDILVVGDHAKDNQTSKRDKAERYNQKGARIEIIDEAEFARRVGEALTETQATD